VDIIGSVGKTMSIPVIKLNPNYILDIIKIINENKDDSNLMKECIYQFLLKNSSSGKLSKRTALYAYAFHTLRILKLIKDRGNNLSLSVDGKILVNAAETDLESFYKAIAKIIYKIDHETANFIEILNKYSIDIFTSEELTEILKNNGYDNIKNDYVTKWIRLLSYVRIIDSDNLHYKYNRFQTEAMKGETKQITHKEFFTVLFKNYENISTSRRGNPYVPIPIIEEAVCTDLSDKYFTTPDFRTRLLEIRNKKFNGKYIYLAQPGSPEANGLRINEKYYYYLAIFGENE